MKKVFIVHGFEGSPNGGWRPWLMGELEKHDVYACALPMPTPEKPICAEWVEEISRVVGKNLRDDIYLVGHSLGVPAILRFLEQTEAQNIRGSVLVSGLIEELKLGLLKQFFVDLFDFQSIKTNCPKFTVIHGTNDHVVPPRQAEILSQKLNARLVWVKNGGHLNGSAGWLKLPQCVDALMEMMQ